MSFNTLVTDVSAVFYAPLQAPGDTTTSSFFVNSSNAVAIRHFPDTSGGEIKVVGGFSSYDVSSALVSTPADTYVNFNTDVMTANINVGSINIPIGLTGVSWASWVYLTKSAPNNTGIIISRLLAPSNPVTSAYGMVVSGTNIRLLWNGDGYQPEYATTINLSFNQWTHIAVTFDTSVANFYVNGALAQAKADYPGSMKVSSNFAITSVIIGDDYYDPPGRVFPGALRGTTFFKRVLTPTEITTLYNGPAAATVPDPPTGLGGARGNQQVSLSWTAPVNDGGSPITGYKVFNAATETQITTNITIVGTTATVSALTNGVSYSFYVKATNIVGDSSASNTVSVTPATVPGAPTGLGGTSGNQQVSLSWTAPVNNGGDAITEYKVFNAATNIQITTNITIVGTTATVSALTNGVSYSFYVKATNTVGDSSASNTVSVTPVTVPGAPTNLTAIKDDGTVYLSWTAPASDGGSPITGYKVFNAGTNTQITTNITITGTNATITGLVHDQPFSFYVVATNAVGDGPASAVANTTFVPATVATFGGPLPPYTDPKNPYYQRLIDNPGLVNTSFPVQQGSNDSQIQQNRQGRSIYQYYNNVNTNIPGQPYVPNTQFKSHAERLAYIQGQIAAGRQGRPFYSFLGTGQ